MMRLISILVLSLCVVTASGKDAPAVPVVNDPAIVKAMTTAARALLESVKGEPEFAERLRNYSMEDKLLLTLNDGRRQQWMYWPPTERSGLSIDLMLPKHRALMHELLWTLLSAKGYHKLVNIMQLETFLQATSNSGFPRGIEDYSVTLFGEPSDTVPWAWRFEGHHISLSITIVPGYGFTVTPSFLGTDPAEVPYGAMAGLRVLRVEEDTGRQLINSLSESQRRVAMLPGDPEFNAKAGFSYAYDTPWDLYASNILKDRSEWDTWKTQLKPDGIAFTAMNKEQQATLLALLDEVFSTYRPEVAASYRSSLDLNVLKFAWIGGLKKNEPHYYRIQGSDFLFEYDDAQGNGNHIHEVWRSRSGDFGDDLLMRHRAAEHSQQ